MKNLNFFNSSSSLYGVRWIILAWLGLMGTMLFHDLTGRKVFSYSQKQEWNQAGAQGFHK